MVKSGAWEPGFKAALAGEAIRAKVDAKTPLTVADAAARTGLALRDAENGLNWLSSEFRGQLRVTQDGELVHFFPTGFTKPWQGRDARRPCSQSVQHQRIHIFLAVRQSESFFQDADPKSFASGLQQSSVRLVVP